jgi:hypothetical protein
MDFLPPDILPNLFFFNFFQPAREHRAASSRWALFFAGSSFETFFLSFEALKPKGGLASVSPLRGRPGKHYGMGLGGAMRKNTAMSADRKRGR